MFDFQFNTRQQVEHLLNIIYVNPVNNEIMIETLAANPQKSGYIKIRKLARKRTVRLLGAYLVVFICLFFWLMRFLHFGSTVQFVSMMISVVFGVALLSRFRTIYLGQLAEIMQRGSLHQAYQLVVSQAQNALIKTISPDGIENYYSLLCLLAVLQDTPENARLRASCLAKKKLNRDSFYDIERIAAQLYSHYIYELSGRNIPPSNFREIVKYDERVLLINLIFHIALLSPDFVGENTLKLFVLLIEYNEVTDRMFTWDSPANMEYQCQIVMRCMLANRHLLENNRKLVERTLKKSPNPDITLVMNDYLSRLGQS